MDVDVDVDGVDDDRCNNVLSFFSFCHETKKTILTDRFMTSISTEQDRKKSKEKKSVM